MEHNYFFIFLRIAHFKDCICMKTPACWNRVSYVFTLESVPPVILILCLKLESRKRCWSNNIEAKLLDLRDFARILAVKVQQILRIGQPFQHLCNQPFIINKQEKSIQAMKQEQFNPQYVIPHLNINHYENNYSNFCSYPQNYLQNFTYFSQNQLFPYYYPSQFGQFCQPIISPDVTTTILHLAGSTQPGLINEFKTDSFPQPNQNTSIADQVAGQVDLRVDAEEQKKIQRRLSRIRHITEVNKNRVMRKAKKHLTSYYWNSDENKRYLEFLHIHPGVFELPVSEKKNIRVNVMMSKKVKTRTPQQCHSHHQKMIKKYGSVENILQMMDNQGGQNSERQKIERDQVKDQVKVQAPVADL